MCVCVDIACKHNVWVFAGLYNCLSPSSLCTCLLAFSPSISLSSSLPPSSLPSLLPPSSSPSLLSSLPISLLPPTSPSLFPPSSPSSSLSAQNECLRTTRRSWSVLPTGLAAVQTASSSKTIRRSTTSCSDLSCSCPAPTYTPVSTPLEHLSQKNRRRTSF